MSVLHKEKEVLAENHSTIFSNAWYARFGRFLKTKVHYFRSPLVLISFILLTVECISLILALYWGTITSLKGHVEFRTNLFGWPKVLRTDNFRTAMDNLYKIILENGQPRKVMFWELLRNTLLLATFPVLVTNISFMTCAYVVNKKNFAFNKVVIGLVLFTIVFPGVSSLGNSIYFLRRIGFYDSYWALLWGNINCIDYNFIIWTGAFQGVPNELLDAADIDGAGNWTKMTKIAFPLVRIPFAILFVTGFIGQWNNYQLVLTTMPSMPNLSLALVQFRELTTNAVSRPPIQMAAAFIVCIPCAILFLIMEPYMVGNLTAGSLKG